MVGLDLIEYYEKLRTKVETLRTLDISQYCSKQIYVEGELDRDSLHKNDRGSDRSQTGYK